MQDVSALNVFFSPKSVAVVGASSDPKKAGQYRAAPHDLHGLQGKIVSGQSARKGHPGAALLQGRQ